MNLAISLLSFVLQGGATQGGATSPPPPAAAQGVPADTGRDSARRAHWQARRSRREALEAEREVPLTAALLASAYDGAATRALIEQARLARAADDSVIRGYDANSVERISAWLQIGATGRERLLFRRDRAEHVRWQRGLGAIVDVTGSRRAMVGGDDGEDVQDMDEAIALPYVPGRRTLALGGERGADTTQYTDIDDIIDPLAPGAEAYYRFTLGDSEAITLPSRSGAPHTIRLREVQLHPRRPVWNIALGSLWFDLANGHLVRAIYRFAAPMDVVAVAKDADPDAFKDVPFWVKPMIMPMTASLDAVTMEYGLFGDRFWLPIGRYAEGGAKVNLFHARVLWEVRYRYTAVNGPDTLPHLAEFTRPLRRLHQDSIATVSPQPPPSSGITPPLPTPKPGPPDTSQVARAGARPRRGSAHVDMRSGTARTDQSDSVELARRKAQCAHQRTWDHVEVHDGGVRVLVRTPCDTAALARSPDLPPSIYGDGETTFDEQDLSGILAKLAKAPEPDFAPRPIQFRWGLDDNLTRYNRIEGLSVGAAVADELGLGLSTRIEARIGTADLEPNAEAQLTRTSAAGTVTADVYRRLASANAWGDPFTVGASVWNLLVGDDEGFYYRAWGGELRGTEAASALPFSWRLFLEDEWTAAVSTQFAFSKALGGEGMSARNLIAVPGTYTGLQFRITPNWGTDPNGFQLQADIRGEGAGGAATYIRGGADFTVLHPATRFADAAVTGGAGTLAGNVPPQSFWYLGGLRTIRGIAPGTDVGDAYWMVRTELGAHSDIFRPLVFYDIGWAGDRSDWTRQGRPLSGAGVGASLLDGILRLDIAHGIWPTHSVRVNVYWQGTF